MTHTERSYRDALSSKLAHINFGPIERRLLFVLADGKPHLITSMLPVIDEMATRPNLFNHMSRIRKKIEPLGHTIVCEWSERRLYYRYVITLQSLAIA